VPSSEITLPKTGPTRLLRAAKYAMIPEYAAYFNKDTTLNRITKVIVYMPTPANVSKRSEDDAVLD
jgi:hypothetical protein